MAFSIGKFSAKLKHLYPALSNVIETVWQYTGFALNMPSENAISMSMDVLLSLIHPLLHSGNMEQ